MRKAYEKEGYKSAAYNKAQHAISDDLMTIRFTVKTIEKLCNILRSQVDDVRRYEREIRKIVVDKCGMPQDHFIKHLPAQRAEPEVGREGSRLGQGLQGRCWRATCPRCRNCSRS
jgi:RNA polymerase primary sigma factor